MTSTAQNQDPGVYVTNDVGIEVTDGARSRVQLGHLTATGDFGIRVVSSDGTTVIIDGTSDMFRISASGTLSNTQTDPGENTVTATLTGLGALAATPAFMAFSGSGAGSSNSRHSNPLANGYGYKVWGAFASGGSPNVGTVGISNWAEGYTGLDGSDQCVVSWFHRYYDTSGPSVTYYLRYYILAQTAI